MRKLMFFAILLLSTIIVSLSTQETKASTPCAYVLDLGAEKCCAMGGNCCGPFNCE